MLRLMRDYAGSWLIKIILGAIVIVFVFWGVGNFQSQRLAKIASVNGEPISIEEYRKTYNNLLEQYRQRFGGNLDDNMLKMLNLKQNALDQLIDRTLLRQEAARLHLRVSDEELKKSIMDMPVFQRDGRFDNDLYNRVLEQNRLTPEEFEIAQRESLLTQKIQTFVLDSVKVSDAEAKEWYQWDNASVNADYALFAPDSYKDMEVTDEELREYYEKNKESYKTEEKKKLQYTAFRYSDYEDGAEVTDTETEEYYQTHTDEFTEEKSVEARHILFKLDKDVPEEEVEKKRRKAEEVMKMAEEGKDFAELAKEYSEGPTKDKGGDLGRFTKDRMVKPFSDRAFSMAAGEISEPVRTQFGWHIIKVEKVNEAVEKKLEEVKEEIQKKLAGEKAKIAAYDKAEAIYSEAYEDDDLKELAAAGGLELLETDFFTAGKGPEKIGDAAKFASTAFALSDKQLSEVLNLGDACYIMQLKEKIPAETSPYEAVAEKVKAALIKEKQEEKAKKDAEAFLAALKEGKKEAAAGEDENTAADAESSSENPENQSSEEISENTPGETAPETADTESADTEDAAADSADTEKDEKSPRLVSTGFFKRSEAIPNIGYEQEISRAVFALSKENPFPEAPLKGKNGYYVIRFAERKLPDSQDFEKEKQSVIDRLLRQKQYKVFASWLAQIKDRSEISKEEDLLN